MPARLLVLFYNSCFGEWPDTTGLESRAAAEFTTDRRRMAEADVVVFHLPTCQDLWRAVRHPGQLWVAWSLESVVTCPDLADPAVLRHFDLTMSYRQDADVWWPYFGPHDLPALMAPPPAKTESAPVVHFQSHRYDRSGRNRFAAELMMRVKVDSYGKLLHNRSLAPEDRGPDEKRRTVARYKFALAFENSLAVDYVTEKFFDPLRVGTVPVYLGAANVADFAPGPHAYIDAADFAGPQALADHLNALDQDAAAYAAYFAWKAAGPSAAFSARLAALESHPLCRLCDLARARRDRGGGRRAPGWLGRRPFLHRGWQPRRLARRLRRQLTGSDAD